MSCTSFVWHFECALLMTSYVWKGKTKCLFKFGIIKVQQKSSLKFIWFYSQCNCLKKLLNKDFQLTKSIHSYCSTSMCSLLHSLMDIFKGNRVYFILSTCWYFLCQTCVRSWLRECSGKKGFEGLGWLHFHVKS